MPRNVVFLIYPNFQLLDAAGPIAAFEMGNRLVPGTYNMILASSAGGRINCSVGVALDTSSFDEISSVDTLLAVGGSGVNEACTCPSITAFISGCNWRARRMASVCSGAYLLATAGLLAGKQATTHWQNSADFSRKFPEVLLNSDRIFVKDGNIWTSAGISAGIDLSLALIEEDLGEKIARQVAQQLVVYYRRPGGQTQHSALLEMGVGNSRFSELLGYIRENLNKPLLVNDLADQVCMTPRHFYRIFMKEIGITPAHAVERLRVEAASAIIESSNSSMQTVARQCGFLSAERMRRAFIRCKGISALSIRQNR